MNFLEYVLFLVLEIIIPLFPLKMWQFLAKVNGLFFYYIIPVRKKVALENLMLAFPEKPRKEINNIVKGCYINVFTVMAEFFYMRKYSISELSRFIKVSNLEMISENLKKGKGLILISAHYGNWELTAYGVSQLCGNPFNVIVKEQTVKKVNDKINSIRMEKGNNLIDMRTALREVLTLLKSNKIVAMLGDQAAPKENVKIDFFVKGVPTFEGAARFAIKTGSALLFGVSVRNNDGTYSVTLHEIDTSKYKGHSEDDVRQLTQDHADLLVSYIKQKPDHWLWFHRRFKHVEAF